MSDVKIDELPAAGLPLAGTELLPVVQDGETRKVAVGQMPLSSAQQAALNAKLSVSDKASLADVQAGMDASKYLVGSVLAGWWSWIKSQAATIGSLWTFAQGLKVQNGLTVDGNVLLNGTNNTAPNQVDVDPSNASLVTADQVFRTALYRELNSSPLTFSNYSLAGGANATLSPSMPFHIALDVPATAGAYAQAMISAQFCSLWRGNLYLPSGLAYILLQATGLVLEEDSFIWFGNFDITNALCKASSPWFLPAAAGDQNANRRWAIFIRKKSGVSGMLQKKFVNSDMVGTVTETDWVDFPFSTLDETRIPLVFEFTGPYFKEINARVGDPLIKAVTSMPPLLGTGTATSGVSYPRQLRCGIYNGNGKAVQRVEFFGPKAIMR